MTTQEISLPIYSAEGKQIDSVTPDKVVFDGKLNSAVIYQAVNAFRANQRKGLASTKTMGEVSGGGRKPWKQKGTGRARVGSTRSPLWRHGGVVFGPHPRDYSYLLPQKIRNSALKAALNAKIKENNLVVLDDFTLLNPKTKEAVSIFSNLKLNPKVAKRSFSVLLLTHKANEILKKAAGNIEFLSVNVASNTHAYEVMTHTKVVITKEGLDILTKRLKK